MNMKGTKQLTKRYKKTLRELRMIIRRSKSMKSAPGGEGTHNCDGVLRALLHQRPLQLRELTAQLLQPLHARTARIETLQYRYSSAVQSATLQ